MTELTARQKANRKYHQKNKERLREKKRQQYADKVAAQPKAAVNPKPAPRIARGRSLRIINPELKPACRKKVKAQDKQAKKLRWDIEDIEFLKQCGIDQA